MVQGPSYTSGYVGHPIGPLSVLVAPRIFSDTPLNLTHKPRDQRAAACESVRS